MSRDQLQISLQCHHTAVGHCWHIQFRAAAIFALFAFPALLNDFSHFDGGNDNYLYLFFRDYLFRFFLLGWVGKMTLFSLSGNLLVLTFLHPLTYWHSVGHFRTSCFIPWTWAVSSLKRRNWFWVNFSALFGASLPPNLVQFLWIFSPPNK